MDFSKEEYELQHFNFSVRQFKEENKKFIEETVSNKVKELLNVLLEKRVINPKISIDIIGKAIKNNILRESVDILKQFDEKITKTFTIPNNVYLPEDYIQKYKYTSEDEKNLEETYNELKNLYTHDVFLHTQLTNELLRFEQIEQCFQREHEISQEAKKGLLAFSQMNEEDFHILEDKKPFYKNQI